MELTTIILIGRSGSGKGTQATLIRNRINLLDREKRQILYVETGDKFRTFIRGKSFSAHLSKEIYDQGTLQPAFLAGLMWGDVLLEELEDNMHLMFDGAPRSRPEAEMLDTAIRFYKRTRPVVININVGRKWSEARLLARGRMDDTTLAKINKRLDWFEKDVVPAIEWYKTNPDYTYIEVNGEQPIEKVHSDIIALYDYDKN
ncbi:MAG: nucleoside monophosphate kinase [Patescibacteria group bacterium]